MVAGAYHCHRGRHPIRGGAWVTPLLLVGAHQGAPSLLRASLLRASLLRAAASQDASTLAYCDALLTPQPVSTSRHRNRPLIQCTMSAPWTPHPVHVPPLIRRCTQLARATTDTTLRCMLPHRHIGTLPGEEGEISPDGDGAGPSWEEVCLQE